MKKKKKKFDINNFSNTVIKNKYSVPYKFNCNSNQINTNSFLSIKEYVMTNNNIKNDFKNINLNTDPKLINSLKIKMLLNKEQKDIINKWFECYTEMYNKTLHFIRNNYLIYKNEIKKDNILKLDKKSYNFFNIRSKMNTIKQKIIEKSQIENIKKNTKIYSHILDEAIHQLCSNIKSAISNLKNGNIKKFRIKYWKIFRPSMTLSVEQSYLTKNQLLFNRLGEINYYYGNQKMKLATKEDLNLSNEDLLKNNKLKMEKTVKINYNTILKEYFLIIPKEIKTDKINQEKNKFISLDPGLRTFLTGITENKYVEIQNNINKIISNKIEKLEEILNNRCISNKIKKKIKFYLIRR